MSFYLEGSDGEITHPLGRDVVGRIVYTDEGQVSVAIMRADPRKISSREAWGGTPDEKVAAYDTYLSYAGTYEIKNDRVIHHVEVSLTPSWTNVDLVRVLDLDGDRLSLNTLPVRQSGVVQTGRLVWERVRTPGRPSPHVAAEPTRANPLFGLGDLPRYPDRPHLMH